MSYFNFTPYGPGLSPTDISQVSNDNFARVVNSVNNIDNSNLSKIAGDLGGAWISWTPTWTNLTVGNAVQSFFYIQIGKVVHIKGYITLGSTSAMGTSPIFTLPVTAKSVNKGTASGSSQFGLIKVEDNTTTNYLGYLYFSTTSSATASIMNASGAYVSDAAISATAPMTWVNGDELRIVGTYEAA